MTASRPKFGRGFLQGSLLGCALLAFGLLEWLVAILVGAEKDRSLAGFSLTPLYVLSFGLGGGALALLRKDRPRWYESVFAWVVASAIVLSGCSAMAFQLVSGKPVEWFWGAGSSVVLGVILVICLKGVRRGAEPDAPPNSRPPLQLSRLPADQSSDSQRTPSSGGRG